MPHQPFSYHQGEGLPDEVVDAIMTSDQGELIDVTRNTSELVGAFGDIGREKSVLPYKEWSPENNDWSMHPEEPCIVFFLNLASLSPNNMKLLADDIDDDPEGFVREISTKFSGLLLHVPFDLLAERAKEAEVDLFGEKNFFSTAKDLGDKLLRELGLAPWNIRNATLEKLR